MTWDPSTHAIALGCGPSGAFVDVSEYVLFNEGDVTHTWGQPSAFTAVRPGTLSFTLRNPDGRFTPGNAAVLDTPVVEGMPVVWQIQGRLVEMYVRSVRVLWGDVARPETARVRIDCDDVLGTAARTRFTNAEDQIEETAGLLARWRMDDAAGSQIAEESGPFGLLPLAMLSATFGSPRFGGDSLPWSSLTQLRGGDPLTDPSVLRSSPITTTFDYPEGQGGAYSFWITVNSYEAISSDLMRVIIALRDAHSISIAVNGPTTGNPRVEVRLGGFAGPFVTALFDAPAPTSVFVSVVNDIVGGNQRVRLYLNGVLAGTASRAALGTDRRSLTPQLIEVNVQGFGGTSDFLLSRLTHTLELPHGELARGLSNIAGLLAVVDDLVPQMNMNASTELWGASISADQASTSALGVLNDALSVEQGYVYSSTSGTLTSPTTELVVRERTRPDTPDVTFVVTEDLLGAPVLARDLNDTVSSVVVTGATAAVTVTDSSLRPLVGDASTSESSLLQLEADLRAWGQDRLRRGANVAIDVLEFTVDARGTNADRWADLLAMKPGDRVRIEGLPTEQLGLDSYEGWLIGCVETHTPERNLFRPRLARTLAEARFDTDRFIAADELTLVGAINSSVTTFSVATSGARLSTTDVPFDIQVDDEVMTVTNCTTATPQVLTVTRGVAGTAAASHSAGAVLASVAESIFGF